MMARIAGIDLPEIKSRNRSDLYIRHWRKRHEIINATGVNPDTRLRFNRGRGFKLREYIDKNVKVEGDLRREYP